MVSCSGSQVQSCCGEGGALQTDICVWGALAAFRPHWVCPCSQVCAFPIYTAQAPSCSIWSGPCVAYGSSFRVLHTSADSVAPMLCAFPALAAQAARSLTGALSPGAARLLPSVSPTSASACGGACALCLAATLPADDHPESQEVFG